MGVASSALIDELHTASTMADAVALRRKLAVLRAVQAHAATPSVSVQLVEQNGLQPLTRCYGSPHPMVRVEAAKALAVVARQPANQGDMGLDNVLPALVLPLLTGDEALKEPAMEMLALVSRPQANKMKLVHEGLLGPIVEETGSRNVKVQEHAIATLEQMMHVPQVIAPSPVSPSCTPTRQQSRAAMVRHAAGLLPRRAARRDGAAAPRRALPRRRDQARHAPRTGEPTDVHSFVQMRQQEQDTI